MAYRFNANEIQTRLSIAAGRAVETVLLEFQAEIRRTLSRPGTGRVYRKSGGYGKRRNARERGLHRASAPGQPPAVDTGTLRRSWQYGPNHLMDKTHIRDKVRPRGRIGTRVRYAAWLQQGTFRMAARPYVNVAANTLRRSGKIERAVRSAFRYARSL